MTPKDSKIRLALYVAWNVIAAASAGLVSVDFSDRKAVGVFVLSLFGVAVGTLRSYIDQTPTQIEVAKSDAEKP